MNFDIEIEQPLKQSKQPKQPQSRPQTSAKVGMFRTKLRPLESLQTEGDSTLPHDDLTKVTLEKPVHTPLLQGEESPSRNLTTPARFKSSVMQIRLPTSPDKKLSQEVTQKQLSPQQVTETKSLWKNKPFQMFDC